MEKVRKPSNSVFYTPSSEPCRILESQLLFEKLQHEKTANVLTPSYSLFLFDLCSTPNKSAVSHFLAVGWDWVHLVRRPLFGILYQPRMIDDKFGAVGGMRIGRGSRSTRRKPAPVPLCPPKIPHGLTRAPTRAAAVGSRRLTAWAMARPEQISKSVGKGIYMNCLSVSRCSHAWLLNCILITYSYSWNLWGNKNFKLYLKINALKISA
jgi:hypothetical protein